MAFIKYRVARPKSEKRVPVGAGTTAKRLLAILNEMTWAPGINGHGRITGEAFHWDALQEAIQRIEERGEG